MASNIIRERKSAKHYKFQVVSTSPRPHIHPLNYHLNVVKVMKVNESVREEYRAAQHYQSELTQPPILVHAAVYNAALTKLNGKLGRSEGFFETWYERQKSLDMISSATREIMWILRNYKKPKVIYKRYKRKLSKVERIPADIPSAWLAYNFGIKPLISSIDSAMSLLNKDFPIETMSGTSAMNFATTDGNKNNGSVAQGKYLVKHGCTVTGINPNIDLAAQTGLTQPFSSAWAVVPWSWAVDYIVNVSEYLSNFEPIFPGLNISDNYTTTVCSGVKYYHWLAWDGINPNNTFLEYYHNNHVYMNRTVGTFPRYFLALKMKPLNARQGSYLTSALALTMKGKSK